MDIKNIGRGLIIIASLTIIFVVIQYPIPNVFPLTILPSFIIGFIAGLLSRRYRDNLIYVIIPIILSSLIILLRSHPYTLSKVVEGFIITYMPFIYQAMLSLFTSISIFIIRRELVGVRYGGK